MTHPPDAIVCTGLGLTWPDGTVALSGLDAAFSAGRTGLLGRNGSGKSTLLELAAGRLSPTSGSISVRGDVAHLDQSLTLATRSTVAELLGVDRVRAALHAIEAGEATEANFAAVGEDWDIEERALAQLDRFGVLPTGGRFPLDRRVDTLSGGETVLTALAGIALRRPAVTLLDEPTNNLDRPARSRLYAAVESWPGVLVVVSHDRELLERVDRIAELRDGRLRTWGGNFTAYTEQLAVEQEAARRMVRAAGADVRREKRQLAEAQVKLARRVRFGKKKYDTKREPRVIMNQRRREAQVSAGKHRIMQEEKLAEARQDLGRAEDAVRDDAAIRISLPGTEVPAGHDVLELTRSERGLSEENPPEREEGALRDPEPPRETEPGEASGGPAATGTGPGPGPGEAAVRAAGGRLYLRGPERVALTGPNGSGKTTLLRMIVDQAAGHTREAVAHGPPVRVAHVTGRIGYLPQRLDVLDDGLSVLDNLRSAAPSADTRTIRAGLARFLVRGDRVNQSAADLSGGERFRVCLARLLLADVPPRLLILDEPTNNLDLDSQRRLAEALNAYRGALLVVSHDHVFLREIGVTRHWALTRGAPPEEVPRG
ncbi:ABC-F family ATP-binding cassette domain-containing protein [Nocardiopsis ganjiahuensis]|uniref:ABC-F family ATP-binding cassette domain-containing protein n=1 Tax=Nocardiopsis ganjiahuensis TaxID=239984 RepID=UPI00034D4353|nr:ATP-binding cassette domain-containing protein [Nocardiopsis ganjiahuensis]